MLRRLSVFIVAFSVMLHATRHQSQTQGSAASNQTGPSAEEIVENGARGVAPPKALSTPFPEYTEDARKKKIQGTVLLSLVVGKDGLSRDVRVVRSLYPSLDQQAMNTVKKWKFQPATKDGQPVAFRLETEVSFRLLKP